MPNICRRASGSSDIRISRGTLWLLRKKKLTDWLDFPLAFGILLTVGFYLLVNQEPLKSSKLHHYTTEHAVEYVVVFVFIWGLVDVIMRAITFPYESLATGQEWLPPRTTREPVAKAAELVAILQQRPKWMQKSRIGQRLAKALSYLQEKGSAEGFNDYLHYLASQDEEQTHANYGLIRFICWVAPVLGILGTVIHFGSAFGGLSVDEIGDNLAKVIGEIGTAFNTTTVALAAAITMMLSLFLCERAERGIVQAITRRTELMLLNRFQVVDESLTPFLNAVQVGNQATLQALDETVDRQLQIWTNAFAQLQKQSEERLQSNGKTWEQSLAKWHAAPGAWRRRAREKAARAHQRSAIAPRRRPRANSRAGHASLWLARPFGALRRGLGQLA